MPWLKRSRNLLQSVTPPYFSCSFFFSSAAHGMFCRIREASVAVVCSNFMCCTVEKPFFTDISTLRKETLQKMKLNKKSPNLHVLLASLPPRKPVLEEWGENQGPAVRNRSCSHSFPLVP